MEKNVRAVVGVSGVAALVALAVGLAWVGWDLHGTPGKAFVDSLADLPAAKCATPDCARLGRVIATLGKCYEEVRSDAARWSAVYWTSAFLGLAFGAFAAVILKIESVKIDDAVRKDLAAMATFLAALLVGISTTGGFERKWQANRIAAAQLEELGYDLLADAAPDSKDYFRRIGAIQFQRNMEIAGKPSSRPEAGRIDGRLQIDSSPR